MTNGAALMLKFSKGVSKEWVHLQNYLLRKIFNAEQPLPITYH